MSRNLIIDWGNTSVKVALFNGDHIERRRVFSALDEATVSAFVPEWSKCRVLQCSVTDASKQMEELLKDRAAAFLKLDHQTPLPIVMAYETPDTLGYDRLANAVAAKKLAAPGTHALAIDAGTCLKFDFVHAEQGYLGGAISPGLHMRYRALQRDTHALPLVDSEEEVGLVGRTTASSIQSGVINGMAAEIDGVIQRYKKHYGTLTIFLTGGNRTIFEKALKNDIFAHAFLTLVGLNDILEFNDIS